MLKKIGFYGEGQFFFLRDKDNDSIAMKNRRLYRILLVLLLCDLIGQLEKVQLLMNMSILSENH